MEINKKISISNGFVDNIKNVTLKTLLCFTVNGKKGVAKQCKAHGIPRRFSFIHISHNN